jgi:hypothetical protein
VAIRLFSLLLKCPFVELFQAKRADEVLRMELTKHGSDTTSRDGLFTT